MQVTREINGSKVGFRFGGSASVEFFKALEKYPDQLMIEGTITSDGIARLLFAAYKNYCALHDQSIDLDAGFFATYIESANDNADELEFIKKLLEMWNESSTIKSLAKTVEKKNGNLTNWDDIEQTSYGELKWTSADFHRSTFREIQLAITGHREMQKYHRDLMRRQTMLICASGMNDKLLKKFDKLWPSEDNHVKDNNGEARARALLALKNSKKWQKA